MRCPDCEQPLKGRCTRCGTGFCINARCTAVSKDDDYFLEDMQQEAVQNKCARCAALPPPRQVPGVKPR